MREMTDKTTGVLIIALFVVLLTSYCALASVAEPSRNYKLTIPLKVSYENGQHILPGGDVFQYIVNHCWDFEKKLIDVSGPWAGGHIIAIAWGYKNKIITRMLVEFHC